MSHVDAAQESASIRKIRQEETNAGIYKAGPAMDAVDPRARSQKAGWDSHMRCGFGGLLTS